MMRHTRILASWFALTVAAILGTMGCSAQKGDEADRVTVGTVQREIRLGMSGAEVIEALGSPNVVTTDEQRREVWVYDKIATDISASGGYWTLLLVGQSGGSASKSQRTLTIVVKFDGDKKVRDFAYHTSRF